MKQTENKAKNKAKNKDLTPKSLCLSVPHKVHPVRSRQCVAPGPRPKEAADYLKNVSLRQPARPAVDYNKPGEKYKKYIPKVLVKWQLPWSSR